MIDLELLPECICYAPKNCTTPIPGYRCRYKAEMGLEVVPPQQTGEREVLVQRPKGMHGSLETIGLRLRKQFSDRFAIADPVPITDNERQVIVSAIDTLLFALTGPTTDDLRKLGHDMLAADPEQLRGRAEKLAVRLGCSGPYQCADAAPKGEE